MTSKVYELDLSGQKIERIENLEKHKYLRVLDLSENSIRVVTNLQNNCDLRELKLYGNKITVIEGLQRLTELCNLHLQHNRIRCIGKGLTGLRKLHVLRLDHNCLEQVAPGEVASLAGLIQLDLSYNQLTAVEGLGCLASLEELRLASNRLQELPNISRCKKLQELDISRNPVAVPSLRSLGNLQQLKILRIESLHITDVASLPVLRSLEELHAASNELQSLKGLPALCPALEMLDVRWNCLLHSCNLLCLMELCTLTELLVDGNPLCVECESYRGEVKTHLPYLELLDGVPASSGVVSAVPLMRPLTPASVGPSMRQVEHQLMAADLDLETYQSGLAARFELLQATVNTTAPSELKPAADTASSSSSDRPSSQCSSRARLQKALTFATEYFNNSTIS